MLLAPFIDHTILKQTTTQPEVQRLCAEAAQYGFAAVCIPPVYVATAMGFLKSSTVKVCTVIGFPFGYHAVSVKLEEARKAVADGADELDLVLNLTALKNGDLALLENELETISTFSKAHAKTLKVIIESGILTDAEIKTCCAICKAFPVNFLKTSTGFAERGASVHAVQLMRAQLPSTIAIKASGGIKTAQFAQELLAAGATRLGCSASVAIVTEAAS
ncbi:MAG TPA: deoxyribose-phosphate aldolase [Chitinophagaceae bacterium]|nr:deoxyribose-phosphate aldolase [Chitinophagaceae bacterium]